MPPVTCSLWEQLPKWAQGSEDNFIEESLQQHAICIANMCPRQPEAGFIAHFKRRSRAILYELHCCKV